MQIYLVADSQAENNSNYTMNETNKTIETEVHTYWYSHTFSRCTTHTQRIGREAGIHFRNSEIHTNTITTEE